MSDELQWAVLAWDIGKNLLGWVFIILLLWWLPHVMSRFYDKVTGDGYYENKPTLGMSVRRLWCDHRSGTVRGRARYGKLTMLCMTCGKDLNARHGWSKWR